MRSGVAVVVAGALWLGAVGAVRAEGWPGWLAPVPEGATPVLPGVEVEVPSPLGVLGYRLGERFTRWEEARGYLEALAAGSRRVKVWRYGSSYEGRPLVVVAVSSEGNLGRLEEIRRARVRLAEPGGLGEAERERLVRETPAVVWLGYGIHGNESSSMEAALGTAYALAAAGGEWAQRLERVVVLIDPLQNPDGRERYLAAYQQRRGRRPDPDPDAAEHREPWPGGRGNHYLFDLNRDWTWATQRETRYRLAEYRRWEPQVFVDLHEMAPQAAYFFPPSAEPVHPAIDPAVIDWLDVFGRANAAAFDRAGWLYFKAEGFDLYYPGYGDSYPSLRGAVGMTYEVGGGGRAGEALTLADGSLLTLASRTARHLVTSLATVATAADRAEELNAGFVAGRLARTAAAPRTYLWPADAAEAEPLARLLGRHGVRVARLSTAATLPARRLDDRAAGAPAAVPFAAGTWAVTTAQPLGRLVEALMEPGEPLPAAYVERQRDRAERNLEPEFYDVTAWALPLAFDVPAFEHDGPPAGLAAVALEPWDDGDAEDDLPGSGPAAGGATATGSPRSVESAADVAQGSSEPAAGTEAAAPVPAPTGDGARLGWLIPWRGLDGYRTAARLLAEGVPLRVALTGIATAGGPAGAGTLFVPRLGAPGDLDRRIAETAGGAARPVGASYAPGTSLGSERVVAVPPPRVALIGGEGVSRTAFGHLWHLLDRAVGLPVTRLDAERLGDVDLDDFTAVVLPDGDYGERLAGGAGDALVAWLRRGGVLVATGDALDWLRERELTAVRPWPPKGDGPAAEGSAGTANAPAPAADPEAPDASGTEAPGAVARRLLATPGAVVATRSTPDHPLAAGPPAPPPVLFAGDRVWLATGDPQVDVLTAAGDDPVVAGFAWPEARRRLAGTLLVATERVGQGRLVLFAQDPAFRGFWRATAPLLLNAVLYGPAWTADRY